MPQGLQIWDASGTLILDITDRILRHASTGASDTTPSTDVDISDQTSSISGTTPPAAPNDSATF